MPGGVFSGSGSTSPSASSLASILIGLLLDNPVLS